MTGNWLAARRTELAADRILDAAGALFETRAVAAVGMNEIAKAADCSRATLYRYFENREALHTAYVHREARRVFSEVGAEIGGVVDPRERLTVGVLASLRLVRSSPGLISWFAKAQPLIGGEYAESEVVRAMGAAFLHSLDPDGASDAGLEARRARWLVRVIIQLLVFPGRDDADERAMIEEFVVPIVAPAAARR